MYYQRQKNRIRQLKRSLKFMVVLMALITGTGCMSRYATTGEALYKQSHNGPLLVVPSSLTRNNISSFYVLPNPETPVRGV